MKNKQKQGLKALPWLFIAAIYISVIWVDFNHKFWHNQERVIFWDVKNYYCYLPAAFIYKDMGMNFKDEDPEKFGNLIWVIPTETGKYTNKMSMGLSFAYAPFFLVAHQLAEPMGYEADGYSVPYRFFLIMSSGAYLLLGMILLTLLLRRWYSPWVVALSVLSVTVGTNLYFYSTIEAAMSHSYSFALFAAFFLFTVMYYEKPRFGIAILLGLLAGWISLIRPTNILIVLVFAFWGIYSLGTLRARLHLWQKKWTHIGLMVVLAFLVWVPQFLYWKYTTGSWVYYSYGEEGFFFDSPAILDGLFSYRKGWLLYTPIMVFALLGIPLLWRKLRVSFLAVLLFTLGNIYVVLSWWSWWYGGSFGLRAFIESYAILALPMAAFWEFIFKGKIWKRISLTLVMLLLIAHSIFQTTQYYYGSIHWDSMSKAAYWDSFMRSRPSPEFYNKLDPPPSLQEVKAEKGRE